MLQKYIFFVAAIALAFLLVTQAGQAQNKSCKRTMEQCIQACIKGGGQPRFCPNYCSDRQRNTGCP
jgi:hypothetical protein